MSENLDLVRSIYADWQLGDFSSTEWAHPKLEYILADGPSPGRWTGLAGLAQGSREILSAWAEFRMAADDYRELDDERVLVLDHNIGRGKASGLEVGEMRSLGASLFHIDDGRVTTLVQYFDRDRALADLGLKE